MGQLSRPPPPNSPTASQTTLQLAKTLRVGENPTLSLATEHHPLALLQRTVRHPRQGPVKRSNRLAAFSKQAVCEVCRAAVAVHLAVVPLQYPAVHIELEHVAPVREVRPLWRHCGHSADPHPSFRHRTCPPSRLGGTIRSGVLSVSNRPTLDP